MASEIRVTNIKANDGTASLTVADSTGNVSVGGTLATTGNTTVGGTLTSTGAITASGGVKVVDGGTIGSASDTDAISISSGGLVVDSARPYFQYIGAGNDAESISNGSRAQFDVLVAERGSNYSTSGFYFTTPVAGVYMFVAQLYTYNSTGTLQQWKIESNNTSDADGLMLTTTRVNSPNIGDILRLSWIGYVPADRRISVKNNSGGTRIVFMQHQSHSQFMGALIG